MSGIVCIFGRGRNVDTSDNAERMLDAVSHRGPDGSGAWYDETVGLGHQQLQTTPEAVYDDQPNSHNGSVIVADARIDNRAALIDKLSILSEPSRVPDSKLILLAYEQWGRECVERLVGAFAFVIWDTNTKSVFCARDRFGIKPLYYHLDDEVFAVASEPKALLSLQTVSGTVNDVKIGDFLIHKFEDQEDTYYEDIDRLPPAETAVVDGDTATARTYWTLDPTRTVTLESDAAYERRFRELFEQAVRARLRSNGRVGSDLSGGLDSTAVTVMARELLPESQPLHTFSNVYDDAPASDEREYIETVASNQGITPHYIFLDQTGALVDRDEMLRYFDHPPHDTTHFAKWERLKRIDENGVSVQLTGEMGDNGVGLGLGLLAYLLRTGRWFKLYGELRDVSEVTGAPSRAVFVHNAIKPLVPDELDELYQRVWGDPIRVEETNPTIDPEFVERCHLRERLVSFDRKYPVRKENARRRQHRSLTSGRITATLETIDMMCAPFGVEPRHPFTDVRLVEYALAIPATQKLANGYTRSIVRRSLSDLFPEKIQWRPWKAMVGEAAWNALANEDDTLQRLVDNPEILNGYVDPESLRRSYERFSESRPSLDARSLYKALSLAAWLEEQAERGTASERQAPEH